MSSREHRREYYSRHAKSVRRFEGVTFIYIYIERERVFVSSFLCTKIPLEQRATHYNVFTFSLSASNHPRKKVCGHVVSPNNNSPKPIARRRLNKVVVFFFLRRRRVGESATARDDLFFFETKSSSPPIQNTTQSAKSRGRRRRQRGRRCGRV